MLHDSFQEIWHMAYCEISCVWVLLNIRFDYYNKDMFKSYFSLLWSWSCFTKTCDPWSSMSLNRSSLKESPMEIVRHSVVIVAEMGYTLVPVLLQLPGLKRIMSLTLNFVHVSHITVIDLLVSTKVEDVLCKIW